MADEAIILAGGLGTRLRDTVPGPKCLAPVAGRPFLFYVINHLRKHGIKRIVFSLGFGAGKITEYLENEFSTLDYKYVIEAEPLGTGGAIRLACNEVKGKHVVILNGDTLYKADISKLVQFHKAQKSDCTVLLKPMTKFDRYGVVTIDDHNRIRGFKEKAFYEKGLINGGIYVIDVQSFLKENFPEKFSFEKDYLEPLASMRRMYGVVDENYFIDIGIPEDYNRAQTELQTEVPLLNSIDQSWSLFIDRDGVINYEKQDDYILNWNEFRFYEETTKAIANLSQKFGKIFIVSNQRGVGRGKMTEESLTEIHEKMTSEITAAGGRIDKIYYCTAPDSIHPERKPNPGMAFKAQQEFPEVDFNRSIMIGNKPSDMKFGRNAGMFTVYVTTTHPEQAFPHPDIDFIYPSLSAFSAAF